MYFVTFVVSTYLISQNWLSSLFFLFACLCTWCKFLYLWCYFSSMSANTRSRFIPCSTSSPRSEPGTGRTWWCLDCGRMRCSTRSANPICDFMLWSILFYFFSFATHGMTTKNCCMVPSSLSSFLLTGLLIFCSLCAPKSSGTLFISAMATSSAWPVTTRTTFLPMMTLTPWGMSGYGAASVTMATIINIVIWLPNFPN